MYNEREFKEHIKHLKIRRILYLLIFSIIGSALGVIISDYIVDVLLFNQIWRVIIISISTLFFFWVATTMTSNTEKDIQDGYWKLEVMKNLNSISEKLDNPIEVKKLASVLEGESISEVNETIIPESKESIVETIEETNNSSEVLTIDSTPTEVVKDAYALFDEELKVKETNIDSELIKEEPVANVEDVINSLPLLDFIDESEEKV